MKLGTLIILFLACFSCKTENNSKSNLIKSDRFELPTESEKTQIKKSLQSQKLNYFLENPVNLKEFKETKKGNFTSSVSYGKSYHFNPKIKDSIFYNYNYPTKKFKDAKKIDQILVFKYGKNKQTYNDENEILIELKVFREDYDLGKANLVGLSKAELESNFGINYLILDKKIVYSNKNKVLIIELENSKIKSFKYLKLNTENLGSDLIRKIVK
jgi:hypothetical protein